ncbi:MAG: N-6 DNA methylase [Lachnospiraceae bacterium]|nr:N-6 DNA methylase [Lachnospiraceae bacterium]
MNKLEDFEKNSIEYENSLEEDYKKNNGIFFTDIELSKAIVEFLNIPRNASIIDPCCGTGSFISSLHNAGYESVFGCDFDGKIVDKCRELTGSSNIIKLDTLSINGEMVLSRLDRPRFDYVVGNPPYAPLGKGVTLDTDDDLISAVRNSGSNLFVAAIYRAFQIAKDDGIISLIVPKNLLHISSYKAIRKILLKEKKLISIIELGIHFKTVRGEQIVLTFGNRYKKNNKIKFYSYKRGVISNISEMAQDYYDDEIIVFTDKEEVPIYHKLKDTYEQLGKICAESIRRGRDKSDDAVRGKQIRKFGFKDLEIPNDGNQIFIQNIFSAEAGITASFGGNLKPSETVTTIKLENIKTCKYILGLLHSRVCNFYLIRFGFNNSRLTIHTDAKYLNCIPIVIDINAFEKVVEIVNMMENVEYMDKEWYILNEELNDIVYDIYKINIKDKDHIEREMRKISARKWYGNITCTA